ncbi:MAG TPA: hypothetical protein VN231_10055 [Allosphingosinicella sp.]|nr:hypothetical protein [Allosphingosinicella sp.]
MKRSLFLAMLLLLPASPALATGGFDCRATDGSGIALSGAVGRVVGNPLVTSHLRLGERTLSTTGAEPALVIARSWLDAERIWVDLADPRLSRFEAQLRVRVGANWTATGNLVRGGRTHPVRCEVE